MSALLSILKVAGVVTGNPALIQAGTAMDIVSSVRSSNSPHQPATQQGPDPYRVRYALRTGQSQPSKD